MSQKADQPRIAVKFLLDPAVGKWYIKIRKLWFYHTVYKEISGPGTPLKVRREFDTLPEAIAYVQKLYGLQQ